MHDRGLAGRYYDLVGYNTEGNLLTIENIMTLSPEWGYGTDERGLYVYWRKESPKVKYRKMPALRPNRAQRRAMGIRTPAMVLDDYYLTQRDLLDE